MSGVFVFMAVLFILFLCSFCYAIGYNSGVSETEGRWSRAVARAEAAREAAREANELTAKAEQTHDTARTQ